MHDLRELAGVDPHGGHVIEMELEPACGPDQLVSARRSRQLQGGHVGGEYPLAVMDEDGVRGELDELFIPLVALLVPTAAVEMHHRSGLQVGPS